MASRAHTRIALAVTVLLGVLAATPAAAVAAPPDPALLEAVTELVDGEMWQKVTYQVHRGEEVAAALGVISVQAAPVRGLVAQVEANGDLEFTRHYRNCWYTTGPDGEMAWCEFDAVLPGYGGLTLGAPMVSVRRDAVPERIRALPFRWQSKSWADSRGGLRKVIDYFRSPGAAVTRGTEGTVGLQKRALPMADIRANGNFAMLELVDGAPPSPSPSPTTPAPSSTSPSSPSPSQSASPTATATGADDAGGGAADGGLPVTGTATAAVAGAGALLLMLGLAAVLIGRRRT